MVATRRIALDHNFPEPILRALDKWLVEFAFRWIKALPGNLNELDDHELVYELHRRSFPVMVTNNHRMLDDRRVLVAIEQTRVTVVAIEGAGDDLGEDRLEIEGELGLPFSERAQYPDGHPSRVR